MAKQKITDEQLKQELDKGKTGAEIARKYKLTPPAITYRVKKLRERGVEGLAKSIDSKAVVATIVENTTLDTGQQLYRINNLVNKLLNQVTGDEAVVQELVKTAETLDFYDGAPRVQKKIVEDLIYKITDDRNFAIKACAEIRDQLRLQLDIFKTLYSMQAIQDFQRIVLDTISSVDPAIRDRIVTALHRQRLLR